MDGAEISITILCSLASVAIAYFGFFRNSKRDSEDAGSIKGQMSSDLGYIKAGVDDLKQEQREQRKNMGELSQRVASVEASVKSAHHRIDRIEQVDTD